MKMAVYKNQNLPKLPDESGEDVFQFGSEVPPHVVMDVSYALHLRASQSSSSVRAQISLKSACKCLRSTPTMTVACDASVLGSMMKRMTLMKPKAALTISLVRDDISRQMLYSSCSLVATSMASGRQKATD